MQIANPSAVAVDGLTLDVGADFSSVSGLAVSGFSAYARAGIYVAANDVAVGCTISGTNASGTTAQPNYYGIYVSGQGAAIGVASDTVAAESDFQQPRQRLHRQRRLGQRFPPAISASTARRGAAAEVRSASMPRAPPACVGFTGGAGPIKPSAQCVAVAGPLSGDWVDVGSTIR